MKSFQTSKNPNKVINQFTDTVKNLYKRLFNQLVNLSNFRYQNIGLEDLLLTIDIFCSIFLFVCHPQEL